MNISDAKSALRLYRHGTADAEDPEIAEALKLAQTTPELTDWLVMHCADQFALCQKFRRIAVPAGLKEQIISEHAAGQRVLTSGRPVRLALGAAICLFGVLVVVCLPRHVQETTLVLYQQQMVGLALRDYAMDFPTHDLAAARTYLARQQAPANFILPTALKNITPVGCAVENWQGVKVALLCFRTGKPLASGVTSDLWLFVVERQAVACNQTGASPRFSKINRLATATWILGDKLYLLGAADNESPLYYLVGGKS